MGSVGLGTIKGSVGVVKTAEARMMRARDASPTAVPDAEPEAEAFVILPPGDEGVARSVLEKRKGKSGAGGASGEEEEEDAAGRLGISVAASTLALLIAVVVAVGM